MRNQSIANLSSSQLLHASAIREKMEKLETELNAILGTEIAESPYAGSRPRRKMSMAGRRRIAAAQKARWAKRKATTTGNAPKKARRKFSAAARAKIAAAAKARWAKAKASGKTSLAA